MTNWAVYFYILSVVSWTVSGQDYDEMLNEFAAAEKVEASGTLSSDTQGDSVVQNVAHEEVEANGALTDNTDGAHVDHTEVEVSGTLGSETEGLILGQTDAHEESLKSLTDIARSEISVLQLNETLRPEIGEKVPKFVGSFPGCQCSYEEGGGKWRCKGTIAYPPSVAGDKCCCCGLPCSPRGRCNNEQCLAIGIDQGPEIAAEQKRWEEMMKGADMLIGDDLPGFIVDLGQGRCDQNRIIQGCKKKQLTPLCDHTSYSNGGGCYSPGLPGTKFHNRHFSHWGSHRQYFGIEDDYLFYGMCFYANNPNGLAPCNGDSHCWTNGNHRLSPNARVLATGNVPNIHFNQITSCNGGIGCWRTICVKQQPNRVR